jgi:hypothetical protein
MEKTLRDWVKVYVKAVAGLAPFVVSCQEIMKSVDCNEFTVLSLDPRLTSITACDRA